MQLEPLMLPLALIQSSAAVADTVVTISASPTGLQRIIDLLTSIASIVIALSLIALSIALIPAAWNSRKTYGRVNELIKRVEADVKPILQHGRDVMTNVSYVSAAVREDVDRAGRLVSDAQLRLESATLAAEQRLVEFNALLRVMQEEAESLFISSASTVRGVRAGLAHLASEHDEPDVDWRARRAHDPDSLL